MTLQYNYKICEFVKIIGSKIANLFNIFVYLLK